MRRCAGERVGEGEVAAIAVIGDELADKVVCNQLELFCIQAIGIVVRPFGCAPHSFGSTFHLPANPFRVHRAWSCNNGAQRGRKGTPQKGNEYGRDES